MKQNNFKDGNGNSTVYPQWVGILDHFPGATYLLDADRRLIHANKTFFDTFGTTIQSALGRHITEIVHPGCENKPCTLCGHDASACHTSRIIDAVNPTNPFNAEIVVTTTPLKAEEGLIDGTLISVSDMSHTRGIEERLRLLASVFESTTQGVVITNLQGVIVDVNPAFTQMFGYNPREVIGRTPRLLKSERHDEPYYKNLWTSLTLTGRWQGETWNRHKDGTVLPFWQSISSIRDDQGRPTHYTSIYSDISQLKQSQNELEYLAHHDTLTDLPNRLFLRKKLEEAIARAKRYDTLFAIIFIDIDNFKHINDSLGHSAGDRLLRRLANRLSGILRAVDTVARIGGDEFVVVIEDVKDSEDVASAAGKMLSVFTEPVQLENHSVRATASMGISLYPADGHTPEALLRNADAAMFQAKDQGRQNFQFYTRELTENAFERMQMENNLHHAVEKGELNLVYQPQVSLGDENIVGLEALVRWQHPELGTITPARFIPVADDSGLSISMGRWILKTACHQGRAWLDQNLEFGRVAVNLSGPQIHHGNLVQEVEAALSCSGLPASRLELEISESFIMQHVECTIEQLSRLCHLGINLAIDDFGTGHSSLRYLKELPVHKLKLDRTFVTDLLVDRGSAKIVQTIILMADSLGLTVVAEGVENEAQAAFLKAHQCVQAQGFLFSPPLRAPDLVDMLIRGKPS